MTNYNVVNLNRDVMCMTVIWYHKQSPTTINTSNSTLYFSALFIHSRRLPSIRIALCNRALWCINWGCYQGYKGTISSIRIGCRIKLNNRWPGNHPLAHLWLQCKLSDSDCASWCLIHWIWSNIWLAYLIHLCHKL